MPYLVTQTIATPLDQNIQVTTPVNAVATKEYLVFTHANTPMNQNPTITIDDAVVEFGLPDSGAPYEIKRISATQTIVRVNGSANIVTPPGDATPPTVSNTSTTTTTGIVDTIAPTISVFTLDSNRITALAATDRLFPGGPLTNIHTFFIRVKPYAGGGNPGPTPLKTAAEWGQYDSLIGSSTGICTNTTDMDVYAWAKDAAGNISPAVYRKMTYVPLTFNVNGTNVSGATLTQTITPGSPTNQYNWHITIGNSNIVPDNWVVQWDGNPTPFSYVSSGNGIQIQFNSNITQTQQIDVTVIVGGISQHMVLKLNCDAAGYGYYYYYGGSSSPSLTPTFINETGTGAAWNNSYWSASQGYWNGSAWITSMPGQILLIPINAVGMSGQFRSTTALRVTFTGGPKNIRLTDFSGGTALVTRNGVNSGDLLTLTPAEISLFGGYCYSGSFRLDVQDPTWGSFSISNITFTCLR